MQLKQQQHFRLVLKAGDCVKLSHFKLLYLNKSDRHSRLGIIIAKKRIKQAVHRNLLRRIIRESFRAFKKELEALDIIVIIRSECTPLNKKLIRRDIDQLWVKLIASRSVV